MGVLPSLMPGSLPISSSIYLAFTARNFAFWLVYMKTPDLQFSRRKVPFGECSW